MFSSDLCRSLGLVITSVCVWPANINISLHKDNSISFGHFVAKYISYSVALQEETFMI